jgi:hypothetical protein
MTDRSIALKTQRMAAEMRSNLCLMERSKRVSGAHLKEARKECALYLARTNLIYPPSLKVLGLKEGMPLAERKDVLHIGEAALEETEATLQFQELLATAGRKQIRSNWIWRIGQECVEKSVEGWFGFFVTLTVDPARVPDSEKMWKEGREFRKYIRRLAKVAAKACGQPRAIHDGASCSEYVQHVGVVEHGKSSQHHHMHLLVWLRDIPASWKVDPNRGVRDPKHRTNDYCRHMAEFWPHSLPGIGRAKYFRHEGDVWSRHGFALPYDSKRQRTVRINQPEKAGLYVAKYMDKEDKVWTHRIKATRNLGLSRLRKVLQRMHWRKIEALTWRPKTYSLSCSAATIHTCPPALIRLLAKQENFYRSMVSKRMDWETQLRENFDSFKRMLQSVRDGANPKRMRSHQFYEWVSEHLPDPPGYCEKRYWRAIQDLGAEFPPVKSLPIEHMGLT